MTVNTKIYNQRFFDNTIKLESQSARAAAEILVKHFSPRSVVDVGCGAGIYLAELEKMGVGVLGFDGSPAALAGSLVGDKIKLFDLCRPLKVKEVFDLCLCLEVAEHLPASCAKTLIDSLVKLADTIIFTAATPGQGPKSIGHINEQPPEYWLEKFKAKNFFINGELTEKIKKQMADRQVVWWLVKNLMVLEKNPNR